MRAVTLPCSDEPASVQTEPHTYFEIAKSLIQSGGAFSAEINIANQRASLVVDTGYQPLFSVMSPLVFVDTCYEPFFSLYRDQFLDGCVVAPCSSESLRVTRSALFLREMPQCVRKRRDGGNLKPWNSP